MAKRPRSEAQPAAETAKSGSNELDQSFDWGAAFEVCDQASQSYEQRESRPILSDARDVGSVAVNSICLAPPYSQSHDASSENNHAVAMERKQPARAAPSPGRPVNPYQKTTTIKQPAHNGGDRKLEARSLSSTPKPESASVPPSPQTLLQQKPQTFSTQSAPAASTAKTANGSNPVNTTGVSHIGAASSIAKVSSAHPTKIPRPTTWGSIAPATSGTASARPSSSHGQKPSASTSPSIAIPRPPTWDAKSTTASLPGKQEPGSTSTSSHGSQSMQNNGLPASLNYSPERVQPVNDEYRPLLVKNANLSAPLLNGWTLFSHQKKAILRSLLMRRFILALDMGLGKTLIGCVWAKAFQQTFEGLKILVVCPVSLKKEWKRTAEDATGLQVDDDADSTSVQIHGWSKVPTEVSSAISKYVVVFDEAHSMQSMQAARTKNALKLAQSPRCVGVLMLSGTPMKNGKPLNLFSLLKAARHPFGDHQKSYETHFCAGHDKSFRGRAVWDANGSSNLVQLRQHVSSHLLYMTKEECLDELPPKTREFRQVPVSSRHQLQHDSALKELVSLVAVLAAFTQCMFITNTRKLYRPKCIIHPEAWRIVGILF